MSKYFENIIYGVNSFLTGMKLTWKHFINKKEYVATLQYPHEKWPVPERNIGFEHSEYNVIRSRLHVDIDDCIACMQCERACPVDCIKIDSIKPSKDNSYDCGMTSNDTQKKMIVSRFTIDMSECMYCNLCVYPCPEECIYMVGGPNAKKHDIDYEFSQYQRDGMVFEFADATDDEIKQAGGEKWLEQRDLKLLKTNEGSQLKGEIKIDVPKPAVENVEVQEKSVKQKSSEQSISDKLEIKSFNSITDKMCRGIAKKAFTASKRKGNDNVLILSDVAQALSDAGKMNDDIKSILDSLIPEKNISEVDINDSKDLEVINKTEAKTTETAQTVPVAVVMDIKDLNIIEDKMARGIAKKAFVAAKRDGSNRASAVRSSLLEAGLITDDINTLLEKFESDGKSDSDSEISAEPASILEGGSTAETLSDKPLFEITELNKIEDKMSRGIAKKIYISSKREGATSIQTLKRINDALSEAGKLDGDIEKILKELKNL